MLNNCCFSSLVPGVPKDVVLTSSSPNQLDLTWETPSEKNGVITGYYITWRIVRNDTNHTVNGGRKTKKVNTTSYKISELGQYYFLLFS